MEPQPPWMCMTLQRSSKVHFHRESFLFLSTAPIRDVICHSKKTFDEHVIRQERKKDVESEESKDEGQHVQSLNEENQRFKVLF